VSLPPNPTGRYIVDRPAAVSLMRPKATATYTNTATVNHSSGKVAVERSNSLSGTGQQGGGMGGVVSSLSACTLQLDVPMVPRPTNALSSRFSGAS
jgi:hypothetical protein